MQVLTPRAKPKPNPNLTPWMQDLVRKVERNADMAATVTANSTEIHSQIVIDGLEGQTLTLKT